MRTTGKVSSPVAILQAIKDEGWRQSTSSINAEIPLSSQFRKDTPAEESPFLWYSLEIIDSEKMTVKITDEYYRKSVGQLTRVKVIAEVQNMENLKRFCRWIGV